MGWIHAEEWPVSRLPNTVLRCSVCGLSGGHRNWCADETARRRASELPGEIARAHAEALADEAASAAQAAAWEAEKVEMDAAEVAKLAALAAVWDASPRLSEESIHVWDVDRKRVTSAELVARWPGCRVTKTWAGPVALKGPKSDPDWSPVLWR